MSFLNFPVPSIIPTECMLSSWQHILPCKDQNASVLTKKDKNLKIKRKQINNRKKNKKKKELVGCLGLSYVVMQKYF